MARFERWLFAGTREWACSRARGDVFEIAAGTARNLPHYPPEANLTEVESPGRYRPASPGGGLLGPAARSDRDVYHRDFVDHVNALEHRGHEGARQSVARYLELFPDLRFTVEDQVGEGDRVASRWRLEGTYAGRSVTLRES